MRHLARVGLLVSALLPVCLPAQEILVLGINGSRAPDGNGFLGPMDNVALTEGAAAFGNITTGSARGSLDNAIMATATWRGLKMVFRRGDPAPVDGRFDGSIGHIGVNPAGRVTFFATLTGTSQGTLNDEGIFSGTSASVISIVRENQPEPAGGPGVFNSFSEPTINLASQVAFWGAIRNAGTPLISTHGIFVGSGGPLLQIARTYTAAPGGTGQFSGIGSSPKISNTGQVAFGATLSGTAGNWLDDTGIYMANGTSTVAIARENDLAPGGNGRLDALGSPWMNDNNKVAFYTTLRETTGSSSDNRAIFLGSGGALTKIVRTGDTAPDGDGQIDGLTNTLSVNSRGDVTYEASLRNTTSGRDQGVFWGNGSETITIARSGQPAPEGGSTFVEFLGSAINNTRTVAFLARLSFGAAYRGIYLGDGSETIRVARVGDTLDGSTITDLGFDPRTFNDFRQLAFQASLADGRIGVFLFSPKIKWRHGSAGTWSDASRWTVSLRPGEYTQVEIDPPDDATIEGPTEATTVRSLRLGGSTAGTAELNLQPSGELMVLEGAEIAAGGKLTGDGVIAGNVVNTGTVSPGHSPGVLAIDGNYTQGTNGLLVLELGGAQPELYDRLTATGTIQVAGTLQIKFVNGFTPQGGEAFDLLSGAAISLQQPVVLLPSLPAALLFSRTVSSAVDGEILRIGVISASAKHAADTDRDGRLGLTEILRVIELYNTRNGSVRTGAYVVDGSNTEDGFKSDPVRSSTAAVTLAKYHSADSNRDGKLGLAELLRVIELYNSRSGSLRTGQYHVQPDTEDSFAPGS